MRLRRCWLFRRLRPLVLGEAALEHTAREDADEPPLLDHRHALEVVLLELAERLVDVEVGVDRKPRRLGDLDELRRTGVDAQRRRRRARASSA